MNADLEIEQAINEIIERRKAEKTAAAKQAAEHRAAVLYFILPLGFLCCIVCGLQMFGR
jgi:hypothetical protein